MRFLKSYGLLDYVFSAVTKYLEMCFSQSLPTIRNVQHCSEKYNNRLDYSCISHHSIFERSDDAGLVSLLQDFVQVSLGVRRLRGLASCRE